MPPTAKRKRNTNTNDEVQRPSPYKPSPMAPNQNNESEHGTSSRRSSRGGSKQPATNSAPALPTEISQSIPMSTTSKPVIRKEMEPPLSPLSDSSQIPFIYEYITTECITDWSGNGQKDLFEKTLQHLKSRDRISVFIVFQEVMRAVISERLEPSVGGSFIASIITEDPDQDDPYSITKSALDCLSSLLDAGSPSSDILRTFLINTKISPTFMREQLSDKTLMDVGLVGNGFDRYGTRYSTSVLYKQVTYNLLREDTEGYSKLISEYYQAAEDGSLTTGFIQETIQKINSLVGAFNIDPGRTLDVTLDVFGDMLIKRYKFFVRYLRSSSFWPQKRLIDAFQHENPGFTSLPGWAEPECHDGHLHGSDSLVLEGLKEKRDTLFWIRAREIGIQAFFELGGRHSIINPENIDESILNSLSEEDKKWIEVTKTFPPEGNHKAAQLLGFKLRYYSSDLLEDHTVFPENLVWLAALLVQIGFISLKDIYPHLYPLDDDMESARQRMIREKEARDIKKRPGGGMNALMMAGALVDDTVPPPPRGVRDQDASNASHDKDTTKVDGEEKSKRPEPTNQKVLLVKSLLLVGAIPEALFILSKFPWIIDLDSDLVKYIHRIINHSLRRLTEPLHPLKEHKSLSQPKSLVSEQPGQPKGYLNTKSPEPRKTLKWGKLESSDSTYSIDYKFYWDDWYDNVPVCQTVDDVFTLCATFLNLSGPRIGEDADILGKISMIGEQSLKDDKSESNRSRWYDLCKRILVPALSFTEENTGLVGQVWRLLKYYPLPDRYSIYAEWFNGPISRTPEIKSAFDLARSRTKDVLKRISKTNIPQQARALAKVTHSSPGVVFTVTINQIESYENLIKIVIECAKYFTPLAYDVLTWSVLSSLGAGNRNRIQADGMLTSQWLRALSVFSGSIFRRYHFMDPQPILKYVARQLTKGKSEDLEILEQLVSSMAGIRPDTKYSEDQVRAMAGGPILRAETLQILEDNRYEPIERKNALRLIEALTPSNLAGQLLILIGQERQLYIYRESSEGAPLKVLGNNVDKIHDAFIQYLELLRTNVSVEIFKKCVPDVDVLIKNYDMDPVIAFTICRDTIRKEIADAEDAIEAEIKTRIAELKETPEEGLTDTQKDSSADINMKDDNLQVELKPVSDLDENPGEQVAKSSETSLPMNIISETAQINGTRQIEMTDATDPLDDDATNNDKTALPNTNPIMQSLVDRLRQSLRPNFEETLGIKFYIRFWQLSLHDLFAPKYKDELSRIKDTILKKSSDRSIDKRESATEINKRKTADMKRIKQLEHSLNSENVTHNRTIIITQKRLNKEKDQWLTHIPHKDQSKISDAILQECVFPRSVFSAEDAFYTWKFILYCHSIGTPGFRTMHILDKLFAEKFLRNSLFQCTAREAENFGQFLCEILKELNSWRISQDTYEKNAWGIRKDLTGFCMKVKPDLTPDTRLNFEDFRRLLFKWHGQLHLAIKYCLASKEYMHVRNAIILLKSIHQAFPKVIFQGQHLLAAVKNVSINDTREDLKLSALSLTGDLKKHEKEWVLPQDFRAGTQSSVTSQKDESRKDQKSLDPKAAEFVSKPIDGTEVNGGEVEDGEVDDAAKDKHDSRSDGLNVEDINPKSKASTPIPDIAPKQDNNGKPEFDKSTGNKGRSDIIRGTVAPAASAPGQHGLPNKPEIHGYNNSARPHRDSRDHRQQYESTQSSTNRNRTPEPSLPPRMSRDMREQPSQRDLRESYDRNRPTTQRPSLRSDAPRDRGYDLSQSAPPDSRSRQAPPPPELYREQSIDRPDRRPINDRSYPPEYRQQDPLRRSEYDDERTLHPRSGRPRSPPSSSHQHARESAVHSDERYDRGPSQEYRDRQAPLQEYPRTRLESSDQGRQPKELFQSSTGSQRTYDHRHGSGNFSQGNSRIPTQGEDYGRLKPASDAPVVAARKPQAPPRLSGSRPTPGQSQRSDLSSPTTERGSFINSRQSNAPTSPTVESRVTGPGDPRNIHPSRLASLQANERDDHALTGPQRVSARNISQSFNSQPPAPQERRDTRHHPNQSNQNNSSSQQSSRNQGSQRGARLSHQNSSQTLQSSLNPSNQQSQASQSSQSRSQQFNDVDTDQRMHNSRRQVNQNDRNDMRIREEVQNRPQRYDTRREAHHPQDASLSNAPLPIPPQSREGGRRPPMNDTGNEDVRREGGRGRGQNSSNPGRGQTSSNHGPPPGQRDSGTWNSRNQDNHSTRQHGNNRPPQHGRGQGPQQRPGDDNGPGGGSMRRKRPQGDREQEGGETKRPRRSEG